MMNPIVLALIATLVILPEGFGQSRRGQMPERTQPAKAVDDYGLPEPEDINPRKLLAEALSGPLEGFELNKHLSTGNPDDHLLLMTRGDDIRIVCWSERFGEHPIALPASPGTFVVRDTKGDRIDTLEVTEGPVIVNLIRKPRIIEPRTENPKLLIALAAERVSRYQRVEGPTLLELRDDFWFGAH